MLAKKGGRASCAWSSLLVGREIFEGNLFWQVGDGNNIKFWKDGWIPRLPGCRLPGELNSRGRERLKVSGVINNGNWDLEQVDIPINLKLIIADINIPRAGGRDKVNWLGSPNGLYSVKFGYRWLKDKKMKAEQTGPSSSRSQSNEIWKSIWSLMVQPKVKHFLWKVCHNVIPTSEVLFKRKCSISPMCLRCVNSIETVEHLLLLCDWVKRVWFGSPLSIQVSDFAVHRFEDWLLCLLNQLHDDEYSQALLGYLLWYIWKSRCCEIFQHKSPNEKWVIDSAFNVTHAFWEAKKLKGLPLRGKGPSGTVQKWMLLPKGKLKLNFNGAYSISNKAGGIGFYYENDAGETRYMHAAKCKANSPFHCEAKALLEALNHVADKEAGQVVIESDCKGLVETVHGRSPVPDWQARVLVDKIAAKFLKHQNFTLIFSSRSCNLAADWLAKNVLKGFRGRWAISPPTPLARILEHDVMTQNRFGVG